MRTTEPEEIDIGQVGVLVEVESRVEALQIEVVEPLDDDQLLGELELELPQVDDPVGVARYEQVWLDYSSRRICRSRWP